MINENKIRQIYKSNREQGFRLLVEYFQEPISLLSKEIFSDMI